MKPPFKGEIGGIIQFREQLTELIRARTPLIYLGTIEIKRSLEEIRIVSSEVGADLQVFNLGSGLLTAGREKTNTDTIGVLDMILTHAKKSTLARCLELTQAIETLLGEINGRQLKDDFYARIAVKEGISLKNIFKEE